MNKGSLTSKFGKVGILTGGDSSERDISLATARSIEKVLKELNIDFKTILAEGDFVRELMKDHVDVVFIAMHGGKGESGCVQGMLELLGIPYTGSGVLASSVCMNKVYSKKFFEYHGIKTPKWQTLRKIDRLKMNLPLVFKPVTGGSTIATAIVRKKSEIPGAFKAALEESMRSNDNIAGKVLVEEYIPGREITVGILDGKALPVLEIESITEFYDYKAKYETGMSKHYPLTDIDTALYKKVQSTAENAFKIAGCKGMARVDFRLNKKDFFILEINTIPGMTRTSLLPEAAGLAGMNFNTLVIKILESATKKVK